MEKIIIGLWWMTVARNCSQLAIRKAPSYDFWGSQNDFEPGVCVCVWFIKKLVFPIVDIQISYGYLLFGIIYTCNLQDLHNFLPYWQNQPFKSQPEFWGMSWFCIFKVCTPLEILNKRYQEIYHHKHPHFQAPMNQQGEAAPIIQWLKSGYLRSVQGLVVRKENQSLWITQTIEALIIDHSTCPADATQ